MVNGNDFSSSEYLATIFMNQVNYLNSFIYYNKVTHKDPSLIILSKIVKNHHDSLPLFYDLAIDENSLTL